MLYIIQGMQLHKDVVVHVTFPFVGPVSAVGKRVGPVIERSLIKNPDWAVTIF
jgi:hypothetical protein